MPHAAWVQRTVDETLNQSPLFEGYDIASDNAADGHDACEVSLDETTRQIYATDHLHRGQREPD